MKHLLIILVIFSSCVTQKRCNEKFPPSIDTDVSYVETVKIDTLIQYIPGDTTFISLPFDCPDQDTVVVDNSKQTIKYVVKDHIITVESVCKEDSLKFIITNLETELKESKNSVVKVRYVPKIWKITGFIGILSVLLAIGYLIIKIKFKK